MRTDDGFDVTLEEETFLDTQFFKLSVGKVIKFTEVQILPKETVEDTKHLAQVVEEAKNRINDRINSVK